MKGSTTQMKMEHIPNQEECLRFRGLQMLYVRRPKTILSEEDYYIALTNNTDLT